MKRVPDYKKRDNIETKYRVFIDRNKHNKGKLSNNTNNKKIKNSSS